VPRKIAPSPLTTRRLFDLGVIIKGIDGVLELIVGVLLLFRAERFRDYISVWIAHELALEPGDHMARLLHKMATWLSSDTTTFAAIYLLGHGVIKVFLAVNLLRERMWAFPVSMAFLALFVVYQLRRYTHTHSITLLVLAIVDVLVIAIVWREWILRREGLSAGPA
jgi:uncharacterized membrane protein